VYVHRESKLIYLAHARTASVSTSTALIHSGFERLDPPSDHHATLWTKGSPVTKDNRSEWLVFTTVRNHWDAATSWTFRRHRHGKGPYQWTVDAFRHALENGNRYASGDRMWWMHSDEADVICRFENLDHDLRSVLESRGVSFTPTVPHNITKSRAGRHYSLFFDDESREYIANKFAAEIERFGYTFEDRTEKNMGTVEYRLETCEGCGAEAFAHPWVAVRAIEKNGDQFEAVSVCAACQRDAQHQTKKIVRGHYFDRSQKALALRYAGGTNIGM
jgi:hypothetical protein